MELKNLEDTLNRTTGASVDPERPFGAHTEQGERGQEKVTIRMRDIADCFVIGAGLASGAGGAYYRAKMARSTITNFTKLTIDPLAVMQNMLCEIERRIGIFPNLPGRNSCNEEKK